MVGSRSCAAGCNLPDQPHPRPVNGHRLAQEEPLGNLSPNAAVTALNAVVAEGEVLIRVETDDGMINRIHLGVKAWSIHLSDDAVHPDRARVERRPGLLTNALSSDQPRRNGRVGARGKSVLLLIDQFTKHIGG